MSRRGLLTLGRMLLAGACALATAPVAVAECPADRLPGLRAAWGRLQGTLNRTPADRTGTLNDTAAAAAWGEFSTVAAAVLGVNPSATPDLLETIGPALAAARELPTGCDAGVRARDRAAWQLVSAGYSAAEIGDVLSGRVTRHEVDTARRLLLAGFGSARASAYLDAAAAVHQRERLELARRLPPGPSLLAPPPRAPGRLVLPGALDATVALEAAAHGIDPGLVRAVMAAESGGDPAALSTRGAVGPMQLMPATARMLGVNPWDPVDNVRGGIAYLAGLLRLYGDVTSALVAYNAGPTHADRVRRGEAVLYGETRRYLKAVGSRFPLVN